MEAALIKADDSGAWNYLQGEVSIPVDHESILKTIDNLEKCNAGVWVALARQNEIPCDPFDRKLLKPVLMGILQSAWYKQFGENGVPEKVTMNQETRVKQYIVDLEKLKSNPKQTASSDGKREPRISRGVKSYRLTETTRTAWEKYKGQKKLIIEAMLAMSAGPGGSGVSAATIADAVKDKLETKQPAERVVAFYMNAFTHEGVVEEPGKQVELPTASAPEPEPQPEPEKPKEEKKPAKKKSK